MFFFLFWAILLSFLGVWIYWHKLPKKEKLRRQILWSARQYRRLTKSKQDRAATFVKQYCVQLIHRYRRGHWD